MALRLERKPDHLRSWDPQSVKHHRDKQATTVGYSQSHSQRSPPTDAYTHASNSTDVSALGTTCAQTGSAIVCMCTSLHGSVVHVHDGYHVVALAQSQRQNVTMWIHVSVRSAPLRNSA